MQKSAILIAGMKAGGTGVRMYPGHANEAHEGSSAARVTPCLDLERGANATLRPSAAVE
ncbi:hypothetical protein [Kamptonema formosum]|uniref:hypothetical protein n=1 Tax=Kamptonema formosum TaxID=331992 RepID=UPI0018E261AE|nr:hypothetical protein [Oscillatoria sp. PCC 10802]